MSNDELFDIVDQDNRMLNKQKPRYIVHKEMKDWHQVTHIWIINNKNEILCQQRSSHLDVNPSKWQSFFGGHLTSGQTYEQNALQELKEELGIQVQSSDLSPLYIRKSESAKHFAQVYILWWHSSIKDIRFSDNEVERVEWFTVDRLKKEIQSGDFCNDMDIKVVGQLELRSNNRLM